MDGPLIEPTATTCMVGPYASLATCLFICLSGLKFLVRNFKIWHKIYQSCNRPNDCIILKRQQDHKTCPCLKFESLKS